MKPLNTRQKVSIRILVSITIALSALVIGFVLAWFFLNTGTVTAPPLADESTEQEVAEQPDTLESQRDTKENLFDSQSISAAIETWAASTPGKKSVVVIDRKSVV